MGHRERKSRCPGIVFSVDQISSQQKRFDPMIDSSLLTLSNITGEQLVGYHLDPTLLLQFDSVSCVNRECLTLLGAADRSELIGKSIFDLISPTGHDQFADHQQRAVESSSRLPLFPVTICRLDGSPVRIHCSMTGLSCLDRNPSTLVQLRGNSSEQQSIADHQGCEIPLRTILETAMDGIISMNEEQEIVLFNSTAESIFGWRAEQVLGQPVDVLLPERFREDHHWLVAQFGSGAIERRRMGEQRKVAALRASGEEFPIEASISKSDVNGKRFYTVILRDVSDAVRDRQQIEQQSQILDQVSDAVSVLGLDGRILYWNQAAVRLFGWSADEAIGRNERHLLYRGDVQSYFKMQRETIAEGFWAGEMPKIDRSGKLLNVEHRRTVLRDPSGAPKGYLCMNIDITDRKKRERAALRSQRLESIGTLAGGIAHDLNNVLTPILMGAKLLTSGRNLKNTDVVLQTIVASAQRGAELVKQVLAFAGGNRKENSAVNVGLLVAETRGLMEHTLPKSIQIRTSVAEDCPQILGDPTEISQILMNLCINARDAMADGGQLTIEAEPARITENALQIDPMARPGNYVLLKVIDTGCGMTPDVLDRIFYPFFTTKEVGKGTGLGLATVQGIVKVHEGFINVYSEPGQGTAFYVYLPAFNTTSGPSEEPPKPDQVLGTGMTVLLVDDEPFILQMTSAALQGNGFEVVTANNGVAAVSVFAQRHENIDVVLLDMMMPGMDGLKVLDELRRIHSDAVVIACNGLRTTQREEEALKRGAKAFLTKPYSEEGLLQVLSAVFAPPN